MNIKNWSIGSWLTTGFTAILVLVIILGLTAYRQTSLLSKQTENMYEHPLQVRRSIDNLKLEISELRTELRNLILATTEEERHEAITEMEVSMLEIEIQFDILVEDYLGPSEDISDAYQAFVIWSNIREHNIERWKY